MKEVTLVAIGNRQLSITTPSLVLTKTRPLRHPVRSDAAAVLTSRCEEDLHLIIAEVASPDHRRDKRWRSRLRWQQGMTRSSGRPRLGS